MQARLFRTEAQFLDQLGQVAVADWHIGTHHPGPLRVMGDRARLVPPLGGTDFDLDHRLPHQMPPVERPQGQQSDDRVTARAAGILRAGQLLPMQFRHPVDKARQPVRGRMLASIPARVVHQIAQAEIGRQVHYSLG